MNTSTEEAMGGGDKTLILGISALYHDAAACLLRDGQLVAAAQEERFTRKKHDPAFPVEAIRYCLAEAGAGPEDLTQVAFYDKPLVHFERLMESYLSVAPRGLGSFVRAFGALANEKLRIPRIIDRALEDRYEGPLYFARHHESHAASAFFPSPFARAAILTADGVGEWSTTSIAVGEGGRLRLLRELRFPHSLGLLYSAFTYYVGFRVNSGEYKLMGLAPYGEPRYAERIREHLVELREDGSFRLNMRYFGYLNGLRMTNRHFHELFGGPPRQPDEPIEERHMDLAASIQLVTEEIVLGLAREAHRLTGERALCLAGGVALNCVANGRLLREGPFEELWIQPAAGDAGGALGAALFAWHQILGAPRAAQPGDSQQGSLLGPAFADEEIARRLDALGAVHTRLEDEAAVDAFAVEALAAGQVLGWFQGRMEFGPRALGNRSILADPRDPGVQSLVNTKIKFRESFRPFAPVVLRERVADYFQLDADSPYMLLVAEVAEGQRLPVDEAASPARDYMARLHRQRSTVPAITHVDYSARIQTCDEGRNPRLHRLLTAWQAATDCPVLLNTSFNVRGEPIVCSPEDAYGCFMRTDMDALVLGAQVLRKAEQPPYEGRLAHFEPD